MRVMVVVLDNRIGGPQIRALTVAERLRQQGIETIFVSPRGDGEFPQRARQANFRLYQIPLASPSQNRPFANIRWAFNFLPCVILLASIIKQERVDIVHVNGLLNLQAPIAALLLHRKTVWHLMGTLYPRFLVRLIMPFIRRVATLLIFPSQASQGFYLGNGSHGIPFRLVYEPVDVRRFHRELISPSDICKIRTELGIDSQEVVVGTVGNINPAKGYEYLFSAARLILDRLENIKFLIVGARLENQEAYYRQLQDQITTLNLTDHVILAGYRENVPCFLGLFDLFVMSSISEGFPLAVLEAMAMGLPVVATAVGGIPEQIIDGQSGVIVPPRNVEALAEAIMALLSDPAKRHAIGQEARQRAQSLFSIDICVKEHVYAYEHALRL